jgi:hypothetical protein
MTWMQCKGWKDTEISTYQVMNNGISFKNLESNSQNIFLTGTLIKISVVSGCLIPTDKSYMDTLKKEIRKFLLENNLYSMLTSEEIVTAFRFNAAGVFDERIEHYQNIFNLDYLGKVLSLWQSFKRKVQIKADIEQMRINLFEPMIEPQQSMKEVIDYAKDIWNKTNDFLFIPSKAYDHLKKEGKVNLSASEKKKIKEFARSKIDKISVTYPYNQLLTPLVYSDRHDVLKSIIAKKIAVSEFFTDNERQLPIPKTI